MSTASLLDVPTFNLAMATLDEDELLAWRPGERNHRQHRGGVVDVLSREHACQTAMFRCMS